METNFVVRTHSFGSRAMFYGRSEPDEMFDMFEAYVAGHETTHDLLCRITTLPTEVSVRVNAFLQIFGEEIEPGGNEEELYELSANYAAMSPVEIWYQLYRPDLALEKEDMVKLGNMIIEEVVA